LELSNLSPALKHDDDDDDDDDDGGQLSKGTVFSNPVEEAIRNRSNNALGKAQDEGAKTAREKGGETSFAACH
jgi:hypothetical protein